MTPPRPDSAPAQVSRLLSLLPYLLGHPESRVADVAALFGVSERQIVRDLSVLWFSGLPGLAMGDYIEVDMEAVEGEGVITVSNAPYLTRPLRLRTDEALALLVALRTLAAMPGSFDRQAIERAIVKLEQAAGEVADRAGAVQVRVDPDVAEDVTSTVRAALDAGHRLHLTYWVPARDETTERDVDPMRLVLVDGRLYLEAWCHRAEGVRLFRLDRIAEVLPLDTPAQIPTGAVPRNLSQGVFQPSTEHELVTLALLPSARWVPEYYPCESVDLAADGSGVVTMRVADRAWVRRLVLRLGGRVTVLAPTQLADAVRSDAAAALAQYHLG